MVSLKRKRHQALEAYNQNVKRFRITLVSKDQKFPNGSKVRIINTDGTDTHKVSVYGEVLYTYKHLYGSGDHKRYCVKIKGTGKQVWYKEHQLRKVLL